MWEDLPAEFIAKAKFESGAPKLVPEEMKGHPLLLLLEFCIS